MNPSLLSLPVAAAFVCFLSSCDDASPRPGAAPSPTPAVATPPPARAAATAPAVIPGPWFHPAPFVWALQDVDPGRRLAPSEPWRVIIASGESDPIRADWSALKPRTGWQSAIATIASGPGEPAFYEESIAFSSPALTLPALPRGGYWVKLRFHGDGWVEEKSFYLNVLESSAGALPRREVEGPLLRVRPGDASVVVSGATPAARLRVIVSELNGRRIDAFEAPVATGPQTTIPIPQIRPGRTLEVAVLQEEAGRITGRDSLWLTMPGDSPAAPAAWPGGKPPSVFDFPSGETVSSHGIFAEQRAGLDVQVAGMASRGSGVIQLWVTWGDIEPVLGARDWSNLDAYVDYFTERKIPFVLAGAGGVLFGNGPTAMWADWAMNHEGRYNLWRSMPFVSPSSPAYHEAAAGFTRAMIERYRGNPFLAGYAFLNQGADSGIFQEHFDSILDYSAAARLDFRQFLQRRYASLDALNTAWHTAWPSWDAIQPPLPQLDQEVNLTPAWKDWTEWKLATYRQCSVDLFDPVVAALDPERPVIHYNAKTGPFEYNFRDLKLAHWATADGAGEDYRMGRINSITKNWNLWRQTESHDVPPANLRYLSDMWAESLRNGGKDIRYNLVFNSLSSSFVRSYPQNAKLQDALAWWSQTAPLRASLSQSTTTPPRTGILLSWADMLYRIRVFRWYALPGNRAEELARHEDLLPVTWLSEWTPDRAWEGLDVLLVPEDARVWGAWLADRLDKYVADGGTLVLWGRAGQYDAGLDDAAAFPWLGRLGPGGMQARPASVPKDSESRVELGATRALCSPAVEVEAVPPAAAQTLDARGRPIVLSWPHGKGRVLWCLSETPGESDRIVAQLLKDAGAPRETLSSNPQVDAFSVHKDGVRYVILNRFLGYGAKADDIPVTTQVRIPGLPEGLWTIEHLVPPGQPRQMTAADLAATGWEASLLPSAMQVYALRPQGAAAR